jgi:RNA polymerase sigma-70 factor (ECF subfamily)
VAYTTTLQHFRKRRLAAEADAVFLELCHLFLDEWPDPERRVELEELANVLGKEFRKLPKKQKEVIVLLRQLGHSHEEAAEITGTSVNNVKALVMRATTRLRERLERYRLSAEIPRPGRLGAPQPSPQLAEAGR